jgi:leader peptidase (prepilin peptidase) / N-methyltransferase
MDLFEVFKAVSWFYLTCMTMLGLLVGSFLNVVIHRLPIMMERDWKAQCEEFLASLQPQAVANSAVEQQPKAEIAAAFETAEIVETKPADASPQKYNLVVPRSACPYCGHKITALENIPVVSYVFLRGRCRGCKAPISVRYPLVEALTGALTGFVAWHFGPTFAAACAFVFLWALIALTFIDADTTLLPDDITLPLMWLGLLLNAFGVFTDIQSAVLGAALGYLVLWLVFWAFKFITGKEGMGYGDFKLLAAICAWLGFQMWPVVILLSAVAGSVVGIIGIVVKGKDKGAKIPFGPYLAAAGFIALIWGPQLNAWYLGR